MYKNTYFYSKIFIYINGYNLMNIVEIIKHQSNKIQALEEQNLAYQLDINIYQKRCEQYMQAYDQLQHQLKELIRNRFGKKSERFIVNRCIT